MPGLLTYAIADPIMLSDNESVGAESETDYSDRDVDLTAKGDSDSPYIRDVGSTATHKSSHLFTIQAMMPITTMVYLITLSFDTLLIIQDQHPLTSHTS